MCLQQRQALNDDDGDEEGVDLHEEEKPQIVVVKKGDLTADEVERLYPNYIVF